MNRLDRKLLFGALAFVGVTMKGSRDGEATNGAAAVLELAELIEAFCEENVLARMQPVSDEPGGLLLDEMIGRHMRELRDLQETHLPEDRQTLMKFHDRLEHRKARRKSRDFYGYASDDKLADAVLRLLDEEIEAEKETKLA
jgi:hypothetical protein